MTQIDWSNREIRHFYTNQLKLLNIIKNSIFFSIISVVSVVGGVCTVILMSNQTTVLRLCCGCVGVGVVTILFKNAQIFCHDCDYSLSLSSVH